MGARKRRPADRALRPVMRSPGRPPGCHVGEPGPRRQVGQVGDPELIGRGRLELPRDQVLRPHYRLVGHRRAHELPPTNGALETHRAHQPGHGAACDRLIAILALQLPPHLADAVNLEVLLPHLPNPLPQHVVPPGTRTLPLRLRLEHLARVVSRRGDRQHRADRLDPVLGSVFVDEGHFHHRSAVELRLCEIRRRLP